MAEAKEAARLKALEAKAYSQQKAEEYKIAEKAAYAGETIKGAASSAAQNVKEAGNGAYEHYQNGTLTEAAQLKAQAAKEYAKESGSTLYQKAKQAQGGAD